MIIIIKIIIFSLGLSVGSFLNCLIYRIEEEKSMKGRSYCPKCKHTLSYLDLFPLFSFLFLKGRCRYCKRKISFQYPLIELITGIVFLFIFSYLFYSPSQFWNIWILFEFFSLIIISSLFILIFVYDLKHLLIPDIATYLLIFFTFIYSIIKENLLNGLISAITISLFFLFIYLITKEKGMGFGDVLLSFPLGLFLGYPNFIIALFTSFQLGAIIGIGLIILKKKGIKSQIPFGPFLITGTIIAFLWGEKIIYYYFNFL